MNNLIYFFSYISFRKRKKEEEEDASDEIQNILLIINYTINLFINVAEWKANEFDRIHTVE